MYISSVKWYKNLWSKENDGANKELRSFVRYAIIVTAIFTVFIFVKKDSVIRWIQAGFTISRQERQMEVYRNDIKELDKQIAVLSNDRDTLETLAREQYNFAEPGDDVYLTK